MSGRGTDEEGKALDAAAVDRPRRLQQAYAVWSDLERALDQMPPGHPAELLVRRAIIEAEGFWRTLQQQTHPGHSP